MVVNCSHPVSDLAVSTIAGVSLQTKVKSTVTSIHHQRLTLGVANWHRVCLFSSLMHMHIWTNLLTHSINYLRKLISRLKLILQKLPREGT